VAAIAARTCSKPTSSARSRTEASTPRVHFAPGVDLLVHVLRADLSRAERVDVDLLDERGARFFRFDRVPFDRDAGAARHVGDHRVDHARRRRARGAAPRPGAAAGGGRAPRRCPT